DISRLCQIVINLVSQSLQCCVEIRVSGQDQGQCFRLCPPHCAYDRKAVPRLADVEVSQQYIECPLYYVVKSFRNGRCGRNFKSFLLQDCRQGEPDIGLIVNKQEPVKLHQITFLACWMQSCGGGAGGKRAAAFVGENRRW